MSKSRKRKVATIQVQPFMYSKMLECMQDSMHMRSTDKDGFCKLCGYKESPKDIMMEEVKLWMLSALTLEPKEFQDESGQFIATKIAESAAVYYEQDNWLNDESHWIWDIAIESINQHEEFNSK